MSIFDGLKTQEFIEIRRIIHKYPELAYHETETAKFIAEYLEESGIEPQTGIAQTGVTGVINKEFATQTLLIRAELDALPVTERTNLPFASRRGGIMHACGHDAHMAMALGAARTLMAQKEKLSSNVKFVFQPAEEGENGALSMLEDNILHNNNGTAVTGAIALHVDPNYPCGTILVKKGEIMAANDTFEIVINGQGGHGAIPTQNSSLSYVCAQIVDNLYSVVPRKFNATEKALISICNIECGNSSNVMPSNAVIRGTIRSFKDEVRDLLPVYAEQIIGCIAAAYDVECKFNLIKGHPPVINDSMMIERVIAAAKDVGQIVNLEQAYMMSDDFAYFCKRVPSAYVLIGCGNKSKGINHPLHSDYFDIDEACIQIGINLLTKMALDF